MMMKGTGQVGYALGCQPRRSGIDTRCPRHDHSDRRASGDAGSNPVGGVSPRGVEEARRTWATSEMGSRYACTVEFRVRIPGCPPIQGEAMPYKDRERQRSAQKRLDREALSRSRAFVTLQKLGKPCVDCGAVAGVDWPAVAFDYDHRDPARHNFQLSSRTIARRSRMEIAEEIELCELRCANCHRVRTQKEQHYSFRK